jgi:hypothetical protein
VELTIRSRGPAIRAEAAADDRYAALDLAFAKLEGRLRRAAERRKAKRGDVPAVYSTEVPAAVGAAAGDLDGGVRAGQGDPADGPGGTTGTGLARTGSPGRDRAVIGRPATQELQDASMVAGLIPIQMEGDGPLVVREKVHRSHPMTIDQALLEMELVGHDFYLFHDTDCGKFSVVYRRRGYDYGVIRLVEEG